MSAPENQESPEGDGVGRHHPLHRVATETQCLADRGQSNIHDAEVEDDHERREQDKRERRSGQTCRDRQVVSRLICANFGHIARRGVQGV